MNGTNLPALWNLRKFYSTTYPITSVAPTQGTNPIVVEIKKYLTGQQDSLSRVFVRVSGNVVVAGAGPGTSTGKPNPEGIFNLVNLTTSPVFGNALPLNGVSARGLKTDALFNRGWDRTFTPIPDVAGTYPVDIWYELNFRRADLTVVEGIDYALATGRYTSLLLTTVMGGRDQLFSGGSNTWNLSGLNVDFYADIDVAVNPQFIHAHEIFENVYSIPASNSDFRIDTLPSGFIYSDMFFVAEEANVPTNSIINNISIFSGSNIWTNKGESNAAAIRELFGRSNNREISVNDETLTGIYPLPLRDGMFNRGFDARYSQMVVSLDVTAGAASQIRLVGRRMIPGAVYTRSK